MPRSAAERRLAEGLAALLMLAALLAVPARAVEPAAGAAAPARAAAPAAGAAAPMRVLVAVLPFEVHTSKPAAYLESSLADLLTTRLEASGQVQVVDSVTVRESLIAYPGERTDDLLRRLAAELHADYVVVGSLTELAGRYSLDVRVTPADSRVTTATMVLTAEGDDELLDRVNEMAGRILASIGSESSSERVAEVRVEGLPELEEKARAVVEVAPGTPYDSHRTAADVQRLKEVPGVASATVATQRSAAGVTVIYRLVGTEQILPPSEKPVAADVIAEIRVRGNRRIEASAILARVTAKAGEGYNPNQIAHDVREIQALGFFRNVRVYSEESLDGRIVTFEVEENPIVRQVTVSGNEAIDGDKIRDNLTITTGSTLDLPLVFENRERIEALYRAEGYYLASVQYEVEPLQGDAVAVHYDIDEKEKLRLVSIEFTGNEHFTAKQLEAGMKTKTWHWYSYVTRFLDKSGTYSEPVFAQDLQGVLSMYMDAGYIQVEVDEPDVEPTTDGLIVRVAVKEGPRFKVGTVTVAGDDTVDLAALHEKLKLKEGDWFSRSHLNADLESMEGRYTERGFFLAEVSPQTMVDSQALDVDVTFQVEKGPLYFLRDIDVKGNTTTIDKVVRREVQLVEGQLYSSRAIALSKARVSRLGFFEEVDLQPQQTDQPDQLDLDVKVVEKPTGSLSFGAGYSSQDGFVLSGSVAQTNLFGRAWAVNGSADVGTQSQRFYVSASDPYFLDTTWGFAITGFRTDLAYQSFDQTQTGVDVSMSHALDLENLSRGFLRYTYTQQKLDNNDFVDAAAMVQRQVVQNEESTSLLGIAYRTDTRDDRVNPKSGHVLNFGVDGAGLGGFSKFVRAEGRTAFYSGIPEWFPEWFPFKEKSAVSIAMRAGWAVPFNSIGDWDLPTANPLLIGPEGTGLDQIDDDLKLPLAERYFLGGLGNFQLRGYKARSVGPRRAILYETGFTAASTGIFTPVGRTQDLASPTPNYICTDGQPGATNSQGNGNGKCNKLTDRKISDFADLDETDVIGGNKFISISTEYRFPISESFGLMGIIFFDVGNAFAENEQMWDVSLWRMGTGFGVLWFSPFGPLQAFLGFPIDKLSVEDSQVFEFSVGGSGI